MASPTFLVLNGPNLNLLGQRETDIYGHISLAELQAGIEKSAQAMSCTVECRQSNSESKLIDWLQGADAESFQGIVFNPAAYSHTSLALRDAVSACSLPVLEVHLSNIYAREEMRRTSLISPVAKGVISGLGADGYSLALQALVTACGLPDKQK